LGSGFHSPNAPRPNTSPLCPALAISATVVRGVIRDWASRKHKEYWLSIRGKRQAKDFPKKTLCKKGGELLSLSRNYLRVMAGIVRGHCHLKGHIFTLGLVNSPKCDTRKQASETFFVTVQLWPH
jgi:hypothetical protein